MTQGELGRPLRILVVGSLDGAEGGERAGGTAILLGALIEELREQPGIELQIFDIGAHRYQTGMAKGVRRVLHFVLGMARRIPRCDVVTLHTVTTKLWFTGGLTLLFARVMRRHLLIRKFAGTDYNTFRPWKRVLTRWVLAHCDTYLAETKHLVDVAKNRDGITHCRWFPTHRRLEANPSHRTSGGACRRFAFVGQVREYKGIRELVDAAERLDSESTVDVYGPMFDDLPPDLFEGRKGSVYRGYLGSREVIPVMREHDALVFPTKATTEGYPGVILEAYAAGIPVIATLCGAIPEIVDDDCGLLVPPGDVDALAEAMNSLSRDPILYTRLQQGARDRAGEFSAARWAERFASFCWGLIGLGAVSTASEGE